MDLNLENYNSSKLFINLEKVTNDTFLKIFDTNLNDNTTSLKPNNSNVMSSEIKLEVSNEKQNFTTGFQSFENLQLEKNNRYQYILPYYTYSKSLLPKFMLKLFLIPKL